MVEQKPKQITAADIQSGTGYALNPASGKMEQAYARMAENASGNMDWTDFSFDPVGRQSLAGWAPGYYTDNSGTFDHFMERLIGGGLVALATVATAGAFGVGPAAETAGAVTASEAAGSTANLVNTGSFDAAMGDMLGLYGAADTAAVEQSLSTLTAGGSAALTEGVTGVSSDAGKMLLADAGTTMTDVVPGMGEVSKGADAVSSGAGDVFGGGEAFTQSASEITQPSPGIIDKTLAFAKANPYATIAATSLASGIIGGVGQNITQNELMDKKIQADKDLLARKTDEEAKQAENRRKFIQGGSYFDVDVPIRAKPGGVLRRPDGTPVFGSGIINNAMRPT